MIFENSTRMSGHRFSPDHQALFFGERAGQNTVEYAVYLSEPAKRYTISRFRADDVYANPGSIMTARGGAGGGRGAGAGAAPGGRGGAGGPGGGIVLLSPDGNSVYLQGTAHDKNPLEVGPKTFIDKVAIKTGEKKRLYESENGGVFERVTTPIDLEAGRYIVSRESPTEIAQYYRVDGSTRTALTKNEDVTPDLTRAPKDRFIVERPDGFKFRVSVTLPPGYQKGTRLPAIFWFYPREFATQDDYDRGIRTYNRNEAPNFGTRSMHFFIRLGYAVVEPDAPIVGPTGKMNDNYEHDLRNNLAAVIDELDRRQIVDRNKLAIGGHSYGAFSDGQRDGAHAVLQGRDCRRRRVQPHADAAGVPERAARPLGGQGRLPLDVALPLRQQPHRGAADVPRPRRPERGHRPDEFDAAVPRAERAGQDDGALPVSAGRSRPGDERNAARFVGTLGRVAGQVRQEPRGACGEEEVGVRDSGFGVRDSGREARGEGREARGERRGARGERREARGEGREARAERREARGEGREARGERRGARGEGREARGERDSGEGLGLGAGVSGVGCL